MLRYQKKRKKVIHKYKKDTHLEYPFYYQHRGSILSAIKPTIPKTQNPPKKPKLEKQATTTPIMIAQAITLDIKFTTLSLESTILSLVNVSHETFTTCVCKMYAIL